MPRRLCFYSLLLVLALGSILSCAGRPVPEALESTEEAVPVVLPPYRMVLVSARELPATVHLPEGMVTVLKLGSGRLNASNSSWKALVNLIEDETIRAVVVADAPQGTAALFAELKELRPELLLLALEPFESPLVIQAVADIVLDFDHVVRAYSAALIAARMGKTSMVAVSTPGASDDWRLDTRLAVLRIVWADMGLAFKTLAVPPDDLIETLQDLGIMAPLDTTTASEVPNRAASEAVIIVNDGRLASQALRAATASGAMFIELDRPDDGYAGIAADTEPANGAARVPTQTMTSVPVDGDPIRTLIDAVRNVPGRPGLTLIWPGEQASLMELGALVLAKTVVDGTLASEASLAAVMNTIWPAGQWHASHYVDPQTGVRARNHLLIGADPYLLGRSYLSAESRHMPRKYRQIPDR